MAVPLQRESRDPQLHGPSDFFLGLWILCAVPDNFDLAGSVARILLGMKAIGLRRSLGKTVVVDKLAIDFCGNALRPTMAFDALVTDGGPRLVLELHARTDPKREKDKGDKDAKDGGGKKKKKPRAKRKG